MRALARRSEPDRLERLAATALAAGRIAIGTGLWTAPRPALGALGIDGPDARAVTLARVAATRDIVLGVWQLGARDRRSELRRASLAVAVADAGEDVRAAAHYVTQLPGGFGAVREVCELILRAQGRWAELMRRYTEG